MSILKIECGNGSFSLTSEQCMKLEIKFNLTEYGKKWSFIGDRLYYFSNPRNEVDKSTRFQLNKEQFTFLLQLFKSLNN